MDSTAAEGVIQQVVMSVIKSLPKDGAETTGPPASDTRFMILFMLGAMALLTAGVFFLYRDIRAREDRRWKEEMESKEKFGTNLVQGFDRVAQMLTDILNNHIKFEANIDKRLSMIEYKLNNGNGNTKDTG